MSTDTALGASLRHSEHGAGAGTQHAVLAAHARMCIDAPMQLNENTAFIDASAVYGSSTSDMFRFRNGGSGFMQTSFIVSRNHV